MAIFYGLLGLISIVVGLLVFATAPSAVQEVVGSVLLVGGVLIVLAAAILASVDRLLAAVERLERQSKKHAIAAEQSRDAAAQSAAVLTRIAQRGAPSRQRAGDRNAS